MAAIAKIKNGTKKWYVFINHEGNRKNKMMGTGKKAEARAKALAEEINRQIEEGIYNLAPTQEKAPKLKDYGKEYMKDAAKKQGWGLSTEHLYNGTWKNHIKNSKLGQMRLDEIKPKHVVAWVEELLAAGISRNSIDAYKSALYGIFKRAILDEWITHNPASKVMEHLGGERAKRREKKKAKALTAQEAQDFIDKAYEIYGTMEKTLWMVAFRCGLRPGEYAGLNWEDIDFETRTISITKQYLLKFKKISDPKTYEERKVRASQKTIEALVAWRKELGEKAKGDFPVFFTEEGNRIRENYLSRHWKRLCSIKGSSPYWTRHTYASLSLGAGHNFLEVSQQMGHKDATTTLKHYAHFMKSDLGTVDELDVMHVEIDAPRTHLGIKATEEVLKH